MWACLICAILLTVVKGGYSVTGNNEESNSVYKVNNREQCSKLCDYSSMCEGFIYRTGRSLSECKLLSGESLSLEQSGNSTKDLYSRTTYQKKHPSSSPCDSRKCPETSFCFPVLGTRSYYCLPREIKCGLYKPPTTMVMVTISAKIEWQYSSNVSVRCNPVLYRNSDVIAYSKCGPDSSWSIPDLVCQEKQCSPENIPVGTELEISRNYSVGEKALVRCRYGWNEKGGGNEAVCLVDETWKLNLICERVQCPLLTFPGNDMEVTSMTGSEPVFEVEATIDCARGYTEINGTGLSVCQGDGTWSKFDLLCQIVDCGPLSPPDRMGFKSHLYTTVYQSEVLYECTGDYRKYGGEDNITCNATGSWTTPTLDCRMVCLEKEPNAPSNAHITSFVPANNFAGKTLKYSCNESKKYYYKSGRNTTVCQDNNEGKLEWSTVDMICVYKCSNPPDMYPETNFKLKTVEGGVGLFNLGEQVVYYCLLQLFGLNEKSAVCRMSGWELEDGAKQSCLLLRETD